MKMTRKLIAIDLDGTLLREDHSVSERTKDLLNRLHNEGHIVVIATGRILSSARATAKTLGLDLPLIGCNGAVIYMPNENEYIRDTLSKEKAYELIELFQRHGIYHHFYDDDTIYCTELIYTAKKFKDSLKVTAYPHVKDIKVNPDVRPYVDDHPVYKFGIYESADYDFDAVKREIDAIDGVFSVFSNIGLCDIMKNGINKWSSIQKLMEKYAIKKEDVITFGDSPNDEQMIANAGIGVAMGNASDIVKSVSKAQTKSNDEDGVYHYLANILNL